MPRWHTSTSCRPSTNSCGGTSDLRLLVTSRVRLRHSLEVVVEGLGGHPLAIEIAASWVDVMGLEGLEAQVQGSWVPLHSEDLDGPARRRDVLAVVQEAWEVLAVDAAILDEVEGWLGGWVDALALDAREAQLQVVEERGLGGLGVRDAQGP